MELQEIKSRLNILEVAHHLSIEINTKTHRALCPFHPDKTPSLQFSKEKQICTCFSSNCTAGTMDVIGLVEKKLNLSTHEALKYLTRLAGETSPQPPRENGSIKEKTDYHQDFEQMQSSFMASKTARAYAKDRCLDAGKLSIGYNAFKGGKFSYLRGCITFGLRDGKGKVVSMYGRSVRDNDKARHYYTSNRQGLYPRYPSGEKKKLIMTESIIDAATLLSIDEITSEHEILALYGTNGLTTEHIHAIQRLEGPREIILFVDGDQAGKAAIEKHGEYLQKLFPEIKITTVDTPEEEDINSLAVGHESGVFTQLLKERRRFLFLSAEAPAQAGLSETKLQPAVGEMAQASVHNTPPPSLAGLHTENPNKIAYTTGTAAYYIKGGIRKDLDSLKVTLVVEHPDSKAKSRNKLDLYEDKQTEKVSREAAEKLGLRADLVEHDLNRLTDLLDEYREDLASQANNEEDKTVAISASEKEKCISFLRAPNLLSAINELIGKSGVAGEENNRLFLFGIASSYKMEETLH
ncbi:MAG: CHC2 zinc finger domain-containing protein, partial [Cyclobacteriaceae bacterium]|nr:CHC2 zinc finger domain-containing protein [Cyclobacteriaceae bacterium]